MTLEEVAKYLRVHKSTVYRMAREGTIPSTKVANQWRFKKARIDEWLLEREEEDGFDD
jgi:excisionase family DNA binding protein